MAGTLGGFFIQIGADISEFEKKIKAVQRGLNQAVGRDFARFAGQVRTAMAGAAAAMGLVGVAAVKSAAQFEQQKIAFTSLLKSGDRATAMLKDIQKFASATPFEFNDLVDASKKMLAFGFEAEKVLPTLRSVGDAASGLGLGADGIDRIIRALGQMQQKGKVSAQEINQLAEAGIGAWEYIAKAAGKSVADVQKASEKGLISGKAGVAAILAGMDDQFKGLMEKQSGTINGILSNIRDNIGEAMRGLGQGLIDSLPIKDALAGIRDEIGKFSALVTNSGFVNAIQLVFIKYLGYDAYDALRRTASAIQWVVERLASFGKMMSDMVGKTTAINFVLSALAVVIGTTLVFSISQLSLALARLTVAHPWLLALTAAATLAVTAFQKWNEITTIVSIFWEMLKTKFANGTAALIEATNFLGNVIGAAVAVVMASIVRMTTGVLQIVVDTIRSYLPMGFGWIADAMQAVADKTKDIYAFLNKQASDHATKASDAVSRLTYAWGKNKKVLNERVTEIMKASAAEKLAAEQAQAFHELEMTYGKRIAEAFDDAKTSIINAYENIRAVGSGAWDAAIGAANDYIKKLFGVVGAISTAVDWLLRLKGVFGESGAAPPAFEMPAFDTAKPNGGGGGKGKSAADQAREAAELYRSTFREFRDLQKELRAPQAGAAGLFQQLDDEIMGVRDHWFDALDEIAAKWDETSKMGRDSIIKAMQEAGIQYQVSENGKLDLTRQRMFAETQLEQEKERRRMEIINSGKALEAELDRLANERNLMGYTQLLNSRNAAFLAQLEGERQAMDAYRSLMLEANRSSLSYMAEASQVLTQGLTDAIVGVVTGTKKAGEAFRELGKQIITMVVRWMVQRAVSAAMAKTLETGMAATSSAAAATINAAWAPAAANVAVATMGAAVGPAMAGLTAATASYRAMNMVGMAKGGIVKGPTMALIGEGRDDEAVIPLNDRVLSKIGGGGRGDVRVVVNNQTGVQARARAEASFDAQGTVVQIFLDALDRDVSGIRGQIAAVRG